jgi:thiol-disulfide isomerase/thioredoxin
MKITTKIILIALIFANFSLMAKNNRFNFAKIAPILTNAKGKTAKLDLKHKKYILVYYSSHWCSACRSFTPKFIDFYKKYNKGLFEVVFMSLDFSEEKQFAYMNETKMPWLAVKFPQLKPSGLFKYAGCVMPWITVFKADGTPLPNNELNLLNHTAEQVLSNLRKTLNTKKATSKLKTTDAFVAL